MRSVSTEHNAKKQGTVYTTYGAGCASFQPYISPGYRAPGSEEQKAVFSGGNAVLPYSPVVQHGFFPVDLQISLKSFKCRTCYQLKIPPEFYGTYKKVFTTFGLSDGYVSYIETAAKSVSLDVFVRIANALEVTADELLAENLLTTVRCVLTVSLLICSVIAPLTKGGLSLRSQKLQSKYCVKTKTCGHRQENYNDPCRDRQPTKGQYPDLRYEYRYLHFR
ncbi:MAG: helix-turn-helix transcriptional regulator [Ruminococcaceae bacterium]|nr:helix-turn-helix transcriptional regulator [Oscillospiraceae bacterium]